MSSPSEDLTTFFDSTAPVTEKIEKLLTLPLKECQKKSNFLKLSAVCEMAKHLNIAYSNKKKEDLVQCIFNYEEQKQLTQKMMGVDSKSHRRNKNTFARLCNFLMQNPNALAKVQMLSNRSGLDAGFVYENQPVIVEAVEKFNDRSIFSGGLLFTHEILQGIDPENVGLGILTNRHAWEILMEVKKDYTLIKTGNFHRSGQNLNDFPNFCTGKPDALYLHFWVLHLQIPELTTYMSSGSVIVSGFDTSFGNSSSSGFNSPSTIPFDSPKTTKSSDQAKQLKRFLDLKERENGERAEYQRLKRVKLMVEIEGMLNSSIQEMKSQEFPSSKRLKQLEENHEIILRKIQKEAEEEEEEKKKN